MCNFMNGYNKNVEKTGMISALVAMSMTILFAIALVLGFWLTNISNILSYVVCFVLAPAFVIMMISIHLNAPEDKKIWSLIGIAFAIIYAIFITLTYYTQLALIFNPPNVSEDILNMFDYQESGSWMFMVDMLGYGFMTLSTLFTAFAFEDGKLEKNLKRIFIFHGIFIVPTLVFPLLPLGLAGNESVLFGSLALIVWCLIFIPLSGLVSLYFRRILRN